MQAAQAGQLTKVVDRAAPAQWQPLGKGAVQPCVCDLEGCCTMITVIDTDQYMLEIYQSSVASLWSCIARIVLPEDIALCQRMSPDHQHPQSQEDPCC